jgi:hypothetical protein
VRAGDPEVQRRATELVLAVQIRRPDVLRVRAIAQLALEAAVADPLAQPLALLVIVDVVVVDARCTASPATA